MTREQQIILEKIKQGYEGFKTNQEIANLIDSKIDITILANAQLFESKRINEIAVCYLNTPNNQNIKDKLKEFIINEYVDSNTAFSIVKNLLASQQIEFDNIADINHFSNEQHSILGLTYLKTISNPGYRNEQMIKLYRTKKVKFESLINSGLYSYNELDSVFRENDIDIPPPPPSDLCDKFIPPPDVIPKPLNDRTNMFIIGIPASGKSTLLAGMVFYLRKIGRIETVIENNDWGAKYFDTIVACLSKNKLPRGTDAAYTTYVEVNIEDDSESVIPLVIFDLAGETYNQAYDNKSNINVQKNLIENLEHENNKVFIIVIDYEIAMKGHYYMDGSGKEQNQDMQLEFILKTLKNKGTLNYAKGLCLVISKWDMANVNNLSMDDQYKEVKDFLDSRCKTLLSLCFKYSQEFDIEFEILPYSLGKFKYNGEIEIKTEYSQKVYDWICTLPRLNAPKSGGFFKKFKKIF
jgi:hypothetical protein